MKDFLVVHFSFKGRIDRWTFLRKFSRLTLLGGIILVAGLFAVNLDYPAGGYAAIAATVLVMLCNFSMFIRRLHDRGYTGWLALISLIVSLFTYSKAPALIVLLLIFQGWLFAETFFLRGVVGPNRYGHDPLAQDA